MKNEIFKRKEDGSLILVSSEEVKVDKEVKIKEIDRRTKELILKKYSQAKQINTIMSGDIEAISKMNQDILEIRSEGQRLKLKVTG